MKKITVHTATYNRAYILSKAYDSLCAQTCKDFEWIITDDGSTDETSELVKTWQAKDNGFEIIYNKLNHVGIPRALNSGVSKASTPWFMMLDSDDMYLPETISKVIQWLDEIKDLPMIGGIGFARCFPDGRYMKDQEPLIDDSIGYLDIPNHKRKDYHLNMDMCEVVRVDLYKRFPFQFWPTEKYGPEQLNYNAIGLAGYKLRWRKDKMYICEYLPDGQTRDNRLVKNNPMGFAMMYNQNLLIDHSFKDRFNDALQFIALSLASGNPQYLWKSNAKVLTFSALPMGIVLALRRYLQFKKM